MKKDHLEILLENISNKLDVVVEGHSALDSKIETLRQENDVAHSQNDLAHKALFQMIKEVSDKTDKIQKENETAHKKILTKTENLESRVTFLEKKTAHQ